MFLFGLDNDPLLWNVLWGFHWCSAPTTSLCIVKSDKVCKKPGSIVISHKLFKGKHAVDISRKSVDQSVKKNVQPNVKTNVMSRGAGPSQTFEVGPMSTEFHAGVIKDLSSEIARIDDDILHLQQVIQQMHAWKADCEETMAKMPGPSSSNDNEVPSSNDSEDGETSSSDESA